jgi:hypothetical protein
MIKRSGHTFEACNSLPAKSRWSGRATLAAQLRSHKLARIYLG